MDDWLERLFGNIPIWLKGLIKEGLRLLLYILVLILGVGIAIKCVKKTVHAVVGQVWLAQKEKGGSVGGWQGSTELLVVENPF